MKSFPIHSILILFTGLSLIFGCSSDETKIKNYLSEAKSYFDAAEYQKAIIQIKNTIQLDNDSVAAYELLAKTHLKLGDAQEAFKALFARLAASSATPTS